MPPISPQKLLQAGLAYYALVFGTGFVLGAIRVPFIVPRIGERWAELAEMPIMAVVIYLAAGFVVLGWAHVSTATLVFLGVALFAIGWLWPLAALIARRGPGERDWRHTGHRRGRSMCCARRSETRCATRGSR